MTLNPEALSAAENAYLKSESLTRRGLVADVVEAYLDVAKPPSHLLTLPEGVTFTELPYLPDLSHPSNWLPGDQIRAKRDTIRISSGLIYTIEGVTDDGSVYLEEIDEFYTFPASLFYFVERPEPLPVEAWEVHEEAIAAEGWAEYPAPRFDYGDLVRRVDDGSEFVIDAIEVSSCPKLGAYFYAADIDSCGFEDGLELVVDLPEVEPKFKIGDRVRVIKTDAVRSHLVEGDEFVVVEVSESHFPGNTAHGFTTRARCTSTTSRMCSNSSRCRQKSSPSSGTRPLGSQTGSMRRTRPVRT